VHGGLRYLSSGHLKLTLHSVRERERLLGQGKGLVSRLGFLLANYTDDRQPAWLFGVGLILYDLLGLKWSHQHYNPEGLRSLCSFLAPELLVGGYRFFDAQTDDARLVFRLIREAVGRGGLALNYALVSGLMVDAGGRVRGVQIEDRAPSGESRKLEIESRMVINAAGAWADDLCRKVGGRPRLRRLRGSHLVFSQEKLPINRAVTWFHPQDNRPVFAIPWEGVTLLGTTDVDQPSKIEVDPQIIMDEVDYLLEATEKAFPSLGLGETEVLASFSGYRAVLNTGKKDPSKESREHVLWRDAGMWTVTGGKLTTFRLMAHDALRKVLPRMRLRGRFDLRKRVLKPVAIPDELPSTLSTSQWLRLAGRYGGDFASFLSSINPEELCPVGETVTMWSELRWAVCAEGVIHLDDILLRRTRLGLLLPDGGVAAIKQIKRVLQSELRWNEVRWNDELANYQQLINSSYRLPKNNSYFPHI
jgi:glycerol-3-phosphate dehydrogenase